MADALDLWERIEVGLDILREYNGTYEAVLAQGFGENLGKLCTLAANIIEARLEESLKESAVEAEKALEDFKSAWVDAGQSIAKLPVDIVGDLLVAEAIAVGVPLVAATVGTGGTVLAVGAGILIAGAAAFAMNELTAEWGPDLGTLIDGVGTVNAGVDVAADATAIEQVGTSLRSAAESTGKISLGFAVALDLVATGVAIDGVYVASARWEAFKRKQERLHETWMEALTFLEPFRRRAEQLRTGCLELQGTLPLRKANVERLESAYGGALYA